MAKNRQRVCDNNSEMNRKIISFWTKGMKEMLVILFSTSEAFKPLAAYSDKTSNSYVENSTGLTQFLQTPPNSYLNIISCH